MTARVLGIDLSLTATGIAGPDWTNTFKPPKKLIGVPRLNWIVDAISDILDGHLILDLVIVEGPSYGSQGRGQHERAGLWWIVARTLGHRVRYAVVPPACAKRYATGKGTAGKDDVIREVTKRFPWFEGDNNAADALVLAAMGADHLGQPLTTMPATHRAALAAVAWPGALDNLQEAPRG